MQHILDAHVTSIGGMQWPIIRREDDLLGVS